MNGAASARCTLAWKAISAAWEAPQDREQHREPGMQVCRLPMQSPVSGEKEGNLE